MMIMRTLAGRSTTPIGLGCMNLSWAYAAPPPPAEAARLLHQAIDLGYDHLDTARLYGGGANEALIGEALQGRRKHVLLASKTGLFAEGAKRWIDGSAATIRSSAEDSLKALRTDFTHGVPRPDGPLVAQVGAPQVEHRADALTDARPHRRPHFGREQRWILVQRRDDLPGLGVRRQPGSEDAAGGNPLT